MVAVKYFSERLRPHPTREGRTRPVRIRSGWGARLRTFARSSHCPFWEEAAEFNDAIAAFLAGLAS